MSLATRCTHCGTIFRVVQDQLKISEGWVRCGRCQEVFSALEGLFDLEREAPPQRIDKPSATEVAAQGAADFVATHHPQPTDFAGDLARESEDDAAAEADAASTDEAGPEAVSVAAWPEADHVARDHIELDLDRVEAAHLDNVGPLAGDLRDADEDAAVAATSTFLDAEPVAPTRWDRRGMRIGLATLSVALVGVLLMQVAVQFRDAFAAQWPESRAGLEALCGVTGCTIEPLRRLAAVSVEASGLTQVQNADAYRLAVTLHNHSAFEVAVPSIDLSLTDGSGGLVSRRALAPSVFAAAPELATVGTNRVLAPGAEVQLQALLSSRAARITGYNVELFYP